MVLPIVVYSLFLASYLNIVERDLLFLSARL